VKQEAPNWGVWLPQMPRLIHRALAEGRDEAAAASSRLAREQRRHTWLLAVLVLLMASILAVLLQMAT
jgi:hypothetical protein